MSNRTQAVFANDPERGNRALLDSFCQHSFVKKTIKNEKAVMPPNSVFFPIGLKFMTIEIEYVIYM